MQVVLKINRMQRIGTLLVSQILVILFVGSSYGWSRPESVGDDYDSMRRLMYSYGTHKRLPSYDFGLGKRSMEEPSSYEDNSYSSDGYNYNSLDKRSPQNMYSFGLGKRMGLDKRSRAYGFGLGKRLEQAWKLPSTSLHPSYRQERRSKIYSFGLGKRGSLDFMEDDDDQFADKRANGGRQFSFGLGKREAVDPEVDSKHLVKNTTS